MSNRQLLVCRDGGVLEAPLDLWISSRSFPAKDGERSYRAVLGGRTPSRLVILWSAASVNAVQDARRVVGGQFPP